MAKIPVFEDAGVILISNDFVTAFKAAFPSEVLYFPEKNSEIKLIFDILPILKIKKILCKFYHIYFTFFL